MLVSGSSKLLTAVLTSVWRWSSLIVGFSVHASGCLTCTCHFACVCSWVCVELCVSLSMLPCCLYHLCLPTEDSSDEENTPGLNRFTRKFASQLPTLMLIGCFQLLFIKLYICIYIYLYIYVYLFYMIVLVYKFHLKIAQRQIILNLKGLNNLP